AYRLLNPNIRQMHEAIRVAAEAMTAQAETPAAVQAATPPSPPKPRQRQAPVRGYLRCSPPIPSPADTAASAVAPCRRGDHPAPTGAAGPMVWTTGITGRRGQQ